MECSPLEQEGAVAMDRGDSPSSERQDLDVAIREPLLSYRAALQNILCKGKLATHVALAKERS